MRNIWTIVKKELARVFTDKRVIFSLFLLPPLTIYLIYGIMGTSAESESNKAKEYKSIVYVINEPESITGVAGEAASFKDFLADYLSQLDEEHRINTEIVYPEVDNLEEFRDKVEKEQIDLIIEFPADFKEIVSAGETVPTVNLYYNRNRAYSQNAYYNFSGIMAQYNNVVAGTRVDLTKLNVFTPLENPLGDPNKESGSILSMLLPMLLVIYLMAGAMGVGIESIAGEKERGTIATLLVTPIKRSELAVGKIISISIIAVLSSISSFIGLLAVLPTFVRIGDAPEGISVTYSLSDYGMLLGVMFLAVLFFVALIVIVSTYAKTNKEAGTLVMPIYLLVIGASFMNMFAMEVQAGITSYLIPVYNVVVALKAIFSFDITLTYFIVTIASTAVYTILLVFLIQKMFRSEKIMFNR